MPQVEDATAILTTLRSDLKREKETLVALLKDPKIADWQTIDCIKNFPVLDSAGIDAKTITSSLSACQQQAKKIAKQIGDWNVEIGNQLADCIDSSAPAATLAAAQRLAEKIRCLGAMKEELQTIIRPVMAANHCLQQQLAIPPLITIATLLAPAKKEQIQIGAAILPLLTDSPDSQQELSLLSLHQEPERLEARYRRLSVTKLPRLIEEILFHHIENALAANREIKSFLDTMFERLEREITLLSTIEEDLQAIQTEAPGEMLKGIVTQGQIMANLLSSLYHKQNFQGAIGTANVALESINTLCTILKNRIIPGLQKEVGVAGSAINPISISTRMTRTFFEGTSGIIRSLKLMMKSLKGQQAVNELELQQILEKGIVNCKTFFGNSTDDLKKIKLYIDGMVGHYPKPFPYNDLFKLAKTTLSSYGEEVEKVIAAHAIPIDMQGKTLPPTHTVGDLVAGINKYKITFQKANSTI